MRVVPLMFGLAPWMLIGWLITAAAIPLAYQGGHLKGRWDQQAADNVQQKIDDLEATRAALEKARDDAATITLRQVEATQRERENRKAAEAKTNDLEAEALETEKRLAEFTCPAVVPPSPATPPVPHSDTPPPPVVLGRPDGSLDLDWVRRNFPPGRISRPAPPAASGRGH